MRASIGGGAHRRTEQPWEARDFESARGFIWGIADQPRGAYKPAQYGTAILPFLVLRRMECILTDQREAIDHFVGTIPNEDMLAALLRKKYQFHFWNRSPYTLKQLLGDPDNLAANLIDYVAGFSANLADIFERLGLLHE